jgi:lysosomal alpha-mannosidase
MVNGGWTQNGESSTHYNSIIDQRTLGFQRLLNTFGKCAIPKVGWQIDTYGHSREQASIFAMFGFDAFFFTRLDYQDQQTREKSKELEFIWKGSDEMGASSNIFTNIMDNGYSAPSGFCFDVRCGDDPIIDDPTLVDYNVDQKVNDFVKFVNEFSSKYRTNNIMIPLGDDFRYENAHQDFKNTDKLIKYVNSRASNMYLFYSTPSCYTYAVNQANLTWTTKTDEFQPYGSDPHSYWTGFFTSRPAIKYYERFSNNFLQACQQMSSFSRFHSNPQLPNATNEEAAIDVLREAMGLMNNHAEIPGIDQQHVAYDIALRLSKGLTQCEGVINQSYKRLLPHSNKTNTPDQVFCRDLNISACPITETSKNIAVTVYNPIARTRQHTVRLPWTGNTFKIIGPDGKPVDAQLIPIPDQVKNIPGRISKATNELVFEANLPPLGFVTFFASKDSEVTNKEPQITTLNSKQPNGSLTIKAKSFNVLFNGGNGLMTGIELQDNKVLSLSQSFHYYKGMPGDNRDANHRASGAYVFRPDGGLISLGEKLESQLYNFSNKKITEVHQNWTPWLKQVIRVDEDQDYVELDWVVGPIPVDDYIGKEIISKFNSSLKNDGVFFTDNNGRQVLQHKLNYRPTWKFTTVEAIAANYYPINSRIIVEDSKLNMSMVVLTDRSQGGSSLNDGSVELMIHRRLLYDDGFGAGEALNEPGVDGKGLVIRGKHYLVVKPIVDSRKMHRDMGNKLFMSPIVTFSQYTSEDDYRKMYTAQYSALNQPLPQNVHILTLMPWDNGTLLMRFEHFYDSKDDPQSLSKSVTFNLRHLFKDFQIEKVSEMSLGANQLIGDVKRLVWRSDNSEVNPERDNTMVPITGDELSVTLKPMQIRTFVVKPLKN